MMDEVGNDERPHKLEVPARAAFAFSGFEAVGSRRGAAQRRWTADGEFGWLSGCSKLVS